MATLYTLLTSNINNTFILKKIYKHSKTALENSKAVFIFKVTIYTQNTTPSYNDVFT
ncbi:protein of unknown function [Tenacibaculum aestuariivivum]